MTLFLLFGNAELWLFLVFVDLLGLQLFPCSLGYEGYEPFLAI
jgi:hypothetical protein